MITVLLVDDEPSLLEMTRAILEQDEEIRVDCALSGAEALRKLEEGKYDVIVADYEMPGMDGIELLKKIKARGCETPFIIFTGKGREHVVIQALNCGADYYLQKGGDPEVQFVELGNMIRKAALRTRTEEAVRRSERRLADIIDFLPDATFAIDKDGKVIAWNRAIEEMTGVFAREMLGQGDYAYAVPFYGKRRPILIDLIFSPEQELLEHQYTAVMRGGPAVMGETCVPSPKGKKVTLWGIATPLFDESGEITGAIESIRDITDRKKAEESLIQVNRKLNLLSSVTRHDILNQLFVLLGYLEITARSVTDPVLSENIARARRAAMAIRQQILFTSDYQDVGVKAPQWHDLVATWQHAAASARQSPSTLVSDGAEDHLPRSTFSLFHDRSCVGLSLYADPLLGKVFANLIENVVKHGGNATMVRLSSHQSPDGVIVVCEDDGRGVPASLKERIFQRGYGSHTGYGLFLAREILSITGLSIRETGVEGKGGRFEILVPHGSFRYAGEDRSEPTGI